MTLTTLLIFLAATFTGSTIQAVSGFGFGIFVMTIFPYILPSATCAALSTMLSVTSSVYIAIKLRKSCKGFVIAYKIHSCHSFKFSLFINILYIINYFCIFQGKKSKNLTI